MPEKSWEIELSREAGKYLGKLERRTAQRILGELEDLGRTENPAFHRNVRVLTGKLKGFYRLRIGALRVIFEIEWIERRIGILAVVPRGNAY
jgi:mRNA interferase RelE/StbE